MANLQLLIKVLNIQPRINSSMLTFSPNYYLDLMNSCFKLQLLINNNMFASDGESLNVYNIIILFILCFFSFSRTFKNQKTQITYNFLCITNVAVFGIYASTKASQIWFPQPTLLLLGVIIAEFVGRAFFEHKKQALMHQSKLTFWDYHSDIISELKDQDQKLLIHRHMYKCKNN